MLHNEFMSNILQNIFKEHYNDIIFSLNPLQSVVENVRRMINCGDPCFGGAMYGCTDCGTLKFFPFRCHSRFCPTCGNKYSIDRTTSMSFKIINVQHRHCVFTIDFFGTVIVAEVGRFSAEFIYRNRSSIFEKRGKII